MSPISRQLAGISLGTILLVAALATTLQAGAESAGDRWRRTAQGWEYLDVAPRQISLLPPSPPAPSPRLLHPLLLALLQAGVIAGAYWRFPVKS